MIHRLLSWESPVFISENLVTLHKGLSQVSATTSKSTNKWTGSLTCQGLRGRWWHESYRARFLRPIPQIISRPCSGSLFEIETLAEEGECRAAREGNRNRQMKEQETPYEGMTSPQRWGKRQTPMTRLWVLEWRLCIEEILLPIQLNRALYNPLGLTGKYIRLFFWHCTNLWLTQDSCATNKHMKMFIQHDVTL